MPADDIRIKQGFLTSRKTRRLERKFGIGTVKYLIALWSDAALHRPRGILTGYSVEDIADAAGFDGDAGHFVAALCETGFLDNCDDGEFALHNWEKRQSWVFGAPERSEWAVEMNRLRWGKKKKRKQGVSPKRIPKRNPPFLSPPREREENARESERFGDSSSRAFVMRRNATEPESLKSVIKRIKPKK